MVNGFPTQQTKVDTSQQEAAQKLLEEERKKREEENKRNCINRGGVWDEASKTCSFPFKDQKEDPAKIQVPKEEAPKTEVQQGITQTGTARAGTTPSFRTTIQGDRFNVNLPISQKDFSSKESYEQAKRIKGEEGRGGFLDTGEAGISVQEEAQRLQLEQGQQLAGQVGQFGALGVSPTGLDIGEAATTGIVDAIPRALSLAGGAAVAGAIAGGVTTGGIASAPLAVAAAAVTFVGSIASSMISNMKAQRRDTTTAQQRVLDEGKQTMKDWATLAQADPANKAAYLAEYNKVSAQIDQAYRQMKLDTSRDVTKFETALPNLAEFEAFYAAGGERDTLDVEMRNSLLAASPEGYNMLELTNRRGQ